MARRRPQSFCQKCRLNRSTITPMAQLSRSGLTMPLSGNELTRNSSGNIRPQSSQLAGPLWTDPGLKSGITVRKLISTLKKKKKAQAGNGWSNILPKSSQARKKPPQPRPVLCNPRYGLPCQHHPSLPDLHCFLPLNNGLHACRLTHSR